MSNLATITNNILADSGIDDINVVVTTGSYANPAWITSLAWTKITGAPANIVTGTGTAGQVAYWSSGSAITGESNLFWDATNDRLGIGTATPSFTLDVNGTGRFSGDVVINRVVNNSFINYGFGTQGTFFWYLGFRNNTTNDLVFWNEQNANPALTLSRSTNAATFNGNVRIGTVANSVNYELEVYGSDNRIVSQDNTNGTAGVYFRVLNGGSQVGNATLRVDNAGTLSVFTGTSSEGVRLTINSTGVAIFTNNLTANRYGGINSLVLNTYATVNPSSNVYLYSPGNDRDAWVYLDSADTGSNWGIYHRQIDTAVAGLPGNSIGFIGGGASALQAWISLANGNGFFAGNLGLGVTPSSWGTDFKAIQIGASGGTSIASDDWNGFTEVLNNVFASARNTYTRIQSLGAARYSQQFGTHAWYSVGAGSGGTNVSFNQAMTLFSSGNLAVGPTSDVGFKLDVNGTGRFSGAYGASSGLTVSGTTYGIVGANRGASSASAGMNYFSVGSQRWFSGIYENSDNFGFYSVGSNGFPLILNYSTGAATFSSSVTATKTAKNTYGIQIAGAFYGAPRLQLYDLAIDPNAHLGLGVDMSGAPYEFSNYFPRTSGSGRWSVGSWAGDFGTGQYVSGYNEKLFITESAAQFNLPLTVTSSVTATSFTSSGSAADRLMMTRTGVGSWNLAISATNRFAIYSVAADAETISILPAGNVGIGTPNPATFAQLHVNRAGNAGIFLTNTTGNSAGYLFAGGLDGMEVQSVDASNSVAKKLMLNPYGGNVLIGTTSDVGLKLQVGGDVYASNEIYLDNGKFLRFKRISGNLSLPTLGIPSGTDNVRLLTTGSFDVVSGGLATLFSVSAVGVTTINNLAGSGNRIVVANSGGALISAVIGSGLAFDGTTLTATGGSSGSISGSGTSGTIALFTGTSSIGNSVITQSGGNVGISTASPNARLHVDGGKILVRTTDSSWGQFAVANPNDAEAGITWGAGGTGYPGITSTYTRQWIAGINPFGTGVDRWSLTNRTLGGNTAITVLENGNVGMGTISPGARFHVADATGATRIIVDNTANSPAGAGIYMRTLSGGTMISNATVRTDSSGNFSIFNGTTSDTEHFRITSSGSVLIGTPPTDNGDRLQVNGRSFFYDNLYTGDNRGIFFSGFNSTQIGIFKNANGLVLQTGGNIRLTIANLGGALFTQSVTAFSFFESSDATLKTLIEDNYQAKGIESVVAKLYTKNGKQELGYFAQDLKGILPSAISKGSDGLLNLSYREVHTAKIAYLEEKIKQLEKKYENN